MVSKCLGQRPTTVKAATDCCLALTELEAAEPVVVRAVCRDTHFYFHIRAWVQRGSVPASARWVVTLCKRAVAVVAASSDELEEGAGWCFV